MKCSIFFNCHWRYVLCSLICLYLGGINMLSAQNQNIEITGTVLDESGRPLPGANVLELGTSNGVSADFDGMFVIDVSSANAILEVSYMGYQTLKIEVVGRSNIDIQMELDAAQLDEIVVLGYSTQKKADVTGATATITASELNSGIVNNPLQAIQGKVAGLTIGSANSDPTNNRPTIRMRGTSSLSANSEPLIVIDGVLGASLNSVAPEDIERVDILKDASSSAIYGSRGANGVIVITTKRGETGKVQIDYNTYAGMSWVTKNPDMLSADEWRKQLKEESVTGQDYGASTDWFKLLEQTAVTNNHSVAISGGTDKFNYRGSLVYLDQPGVVKYSGYDRLNARLNLTQKTFNDRLEIQLLISHQTANKHFSDYQAFNSAQRLNPTYPVYNPDGTYFQVQGLFETDNPLARLAQITNEAEEKQTLINAKVSLEVIKGLWIRVNASTNNNHGLAGEFTPSSWNGFGNNTASAQRNTYQTNDQLIETNLNYVTSLGKSNLAFLAGYSYQIVTNEGFEAGNRDFPDIFGYNNLGAGNAGAGGATNRTVSSYKAEAKLAGLMARLEYAFDDKYLLTANIRRDASSRFGANQRAGVFPSVSLGWRLMEESFMEDITIINNLKLRAGYGVTGNQGGISDYAARQLYGPSGSFYNNGSFSTAYTFSQNANPDLKWETSAMTNIGLDFSLFKSRITGVFEWYNKDTKDLLFNYPIAIGSKYGTDNLTATSGNILANVGRVNNRGVELSLTYDVLGNKAFQWETTVNFAHNKNKIVSLSNEFFNYDTDNPIIYGGFGSGEGGISATSVVQEGYPIGEFYGPQIAGFSDEGGYIWEDNGGGGTDPFGKDRTYLGSPQPKLNLGWSNYLSYRDFSLSFLFRGSLGQKVANGPRLFFENPNRFPGYNLLKSSFSSPIGEGVPPTWSSLWVENASFVRLDNIRLGYKIPVPKQYIRNCEVYLSGQNLLLITGFQGIDPEARIGGSDLGTNLSPGVIPINFYPVQRSLILGLSIGI